MNVKNNFVHLETWAALNLTLVNLLFDDIGLLSTELRNRLQCAVKLIFAIFTAECHVWLWQSGRGYENGNDRIAPWFGSKRKSQGRFKCRVLVPAYLLVDFHKLFNNNNYYYYYYYYYLLQLDRLCGLVVRVSGYRYRGPGFDPRRYQIFWVVVGLERGPLSFMRSNWGATWIKK